MTDKTEGPLDCPVCGLAAARVSPVLQGVPEGVVMYQVRCRGCRAAGPLSETPEEAISLWSRIKLEGECRGCTAE